MIDKYGDKLKQIEKSYTRIHNKNEFLYIRIDGKNFSSLTEPLKNSEPYSSEFINTMIDLTHELMIEFQADIGFHQSDEISLGFLPKKINSEFIFNGKQTKLLSTIPSYASWSLSLSPMAKKLKNMPIVFDARSLSLNEQDFISMFIWRHKDATRNAIMQFAHNTKFVSKSWMHKKKTQEVFDELSKHIDWDQVDSSFKYGTYIYKEVFENRYVYNRYCMNKTYEYMKNYIDWRKNES